MFKYRIAAWVASLLSLIVLSPRKDNARCESAANGAPRRGRGIERIRRMRQAASGAPKPKTAEKGRMCCSSRVLVANDPGGFHTPPPFLFPPNSGAEKNRDRGRRLASLALQLVDCTPHTVHGGRRAQSAVQRG